jgi:hypothetical protein
MSAIAIFHQLTLRSENPSPALRNCVEQYFAGEHAAGRGDSDVASSRAGGTVAFRKVSALRKIAVCAFGFATESGERVLEQPPVMLRHRNVMAK